MREDLYSDNYITITVMPNGQAMYATRYLDFNTMPVLWAKKIVSLLKAGNDAAAYKLIDYIDIYWRKKHENTSI